MLCFDASLRKYFANARKNVTIDLREIVAEYFHSKGKNTKLVIMIKAFLQGPKQEKGCDFVCQVGTFAEAIRCPSPQRSALMWGTDNSVRVNNRRIFVQLTQSRGVLQSVLRDYTLQQRIPFMSLPGTFELHPRSLPGTSHLLSATHLTQC